MVDIEHYGSFLAAILVFQAIPGAGTIAILEASARNGRGAGMAAVSGTLAGDLIFMLAASAGLAAVLRAHPLLFQGLRWFGVAYLIWIGARLMATRSAGKAALAGAVPDRWACFRRALTVSLTNPKVILFFVAFFPLFLGADSSAITLPVMMLHVTVISLVYQSGLVVAGNAVAARLQPLPAARSMATRLAGAILIGLALKLAAGIG